MAHTEQDLLLLIKQLKEENTELNRKLLVCKTWMKKEVEASLNRIVTKKVVEISKQGKDAFLQEAQAQIIAQQVQKYFGDMLLLNAPKQTMEYLINAEINYYNLQKNTHLDGLSVISSYHKILDLLIEQLITSNFRRYAQKKGQIILRVNDPLEKSLHLIVNKKYILSLGRLYGLLNDIKNGSEIHDYGRCFAAYLEKYPMLKELLLGDEFFALFQAAVESEVFGSKRHQGKIDYKETKKIRTILVGDLTSQHSIFYKMLETTSVPY